MPRRDLLSRCLPVCTAACVGLAHPTALVALAPGARGQEGHPFDARKPMELSTRERVRMQYGPFLEVVGSLRRDLGDEATIRLLDSYSKARGRKRGEEQAQTSRDTSFRTFTAVFRPPAYNGSLIHEVVVDTDTVFELRVSECVWAAVFREAGMDGPVGHAALCNMDYSWPPAFNPSFRMERTRTLMQGHDHCNYRYLRGSEPEASPAPRNSRPVDAPVGGSSP